MGVSVSCQGCSVGKGGFSQSPGMDRNFLPFPDSSFSHLPVFPPSVIIEKAAGDAEAVAFDGRTYLEYHNAVTKRYLGCCAEPSPKPGIRAHSRRKSRDPGAPNRGRLFPVLPSKAALLAERFPPKFPAPGLAVVLLPGGNSWLSPAWFGNGMEPDPLCPGLEMPRGWSCQQDGTSLPWDTCDCPNLCSSPVLGRTLRCPWLCWSLGIPSGNAA